MDGYKRQTALLFHQTRTRGMSIFVYEWMHWNETSWNSYIQEWPSPVMSFINIVNHGDSEVELPLIRLTLHPIWTWISSRLLLPDVAINKLFPWKYGIANHESLYSVIFCIPTFVERGQLSTIAGSGMGPFTTRRICFQRWEQEWWGGGVRHRVHTLESITAITWGYFSIGKGRRWEVMVSWCSGRNSYRKEMLIEMKRGKATFRLTNSLWSSLPLPSFPNKHTQGRIRFTQVCLVAKIYPGLDILILSMTTRPLSSCHQYWLSSWIRWCHKK